MTTAPTIPAPPRATDPAFVQALDATAVGALVQRHLAVDADVLALAPDYVRWKDRDGSLVGWRVTMRAAAAAVDSYVTVRTAPSDRLADEAARLAHRDEEQHAGLRAFALAPHDGVLLLAFPIDRAMHDLRRLVRASKVRSLLADNCPDALPAGHRFSKSRSTCELVRYKPERRAVLRWRIGCVDSTGNGSATTTVWLRSHADPVVPRATAAMRAASAAGIVCPRPLGSPHVRLAIETHVEGQPLAHGEDLAAAARTLARLHAVPRVTGVPVHGAVQELDLALRAADDLARLWPDFGARAVALTDRLAATVPAGSFVAFAHGDLHIGQFLRTPDGDAALCDFDRACLAPPARDLASFRAHCLLRGDAAAHTGATEFLAAYAAMRQVPPVAEQAWWLAAALLRLANAPFRALHHDWPLATARLLALAERTAATNADPTAEATS